ncbi:MAG: NAD-dependent epimerase/dehydratase family protein [Bacteroidales bacterium]|nr:NAD-dependent epimerase/dehydratase family protein [Bacteroidales bacterium]
MNSKNFFVTGGAGFIGSNVVKLLLEKKCNVTIYDNLSTGYLENIKDISKVSFIEGDILDKEKLISTSKEQDVVLHLAANIGNVKSLNDPWFDSSINIIGTLNVLDACKKNKINKLVYSSSAAIFGELMYQPIDEKHPIEPDSPYGVSKLAAEKHCLWFGRHFNIKTVALRYFNVYGVNQRYDSYGNVIPIWANLILRGDPIIIYDDGEQTRDFINVEDVALANYLAATNENVQGPYNLGSGSSVTINQLADMMIEVFNSNTQKIYTAKRLGEIRHCKADVKKASTDFGFRNTIGLKEGLYNYYKWLKRQ